MRYNLVINVLKNRNFLVVFMQKISLVASLSRNEADLQWKSEIAATGKTDSSRPIRNVETMMCDQKKNWRGKKYILGHSSKFYKNAKCRFTKCRRPIDRAEALFLVVCDPSMNEQ
jgi:hypothetical protein